MLKMFNRKDEWDDEYFGRAVGRNMWKRVEEGIESLNRDAESDEYKALVDATAGHAGSTKWAEAIAEACESITSSKYKTLHSRAEFITRKLDEALENLNGRFSMDGVEKQSKEEIRYWAENPYHKVAGQVEKMKGKISKCQALVTMYSQYCVGIYSYVKKLNGVTFEDCELSLYLQNNGLTKDIACQMCEKFGAILIEHLVYIEKADIFGDNYPEKLRLDALVTQHKLNILPNLTGFGGGVQAQLDKLLEYCE
jgi:hypothetical protein